MSDDALSLWYAPGGLVELRPASVVPRPGDVSVTALYSGVSRGTERLVFEGRVPESEWQRMRCPHQAGDFPHAVKYGYALVGEIATGARTGERVFVLHPHQQRLCVAASDVHTIPADVPPRRAALAANMETALNVVWDAGASAGDRILVVGAGVLGLLIAGLLSRLPGAAVTVTDINPARREVAAALGAAFAPPEAAPRDQDIVVHTSSSAAGLGLALNAAGTEATVVEASWYGDAAVSVPLGEAFHARRLRLISSQVGAVPASRRARWTTARRMAKALDLLRDARFDALVTGEIAFGDAPRDLHKVFDRDGTGLMTVLRYT
jgi:2-desacetyl-2-hydroxyethyl bacteriochlorophyllide A dehydrogenase